MSSTPPIALVRAGPVAPAGAGELVDRARAGDVRAWSVLYQQHHERVYRRLCFFVGQPAVAEDLAQETFARAVAALAGFDGRSSFTTWLFGIANNVGRNYLRDRSTQRRGEQRLAEIAALGPGGEAADRAHLRRARTEVLYEVLSGLPGHLREAFVLREIEGLSMQEAAAQAGVTTNNMTVRVWRARDAIRRELERLGWLSKEEAR